MLSKSTSTRARHSSIARRLTWKVGGDLHFRSAHQPIRLPGTVHQKHGVQRRVIIREHRPRVEVELPDFAAAVAAMPTMPGLEAPSATAGANRPGLDAVLTTPVREGSQDAWTRFQGASAAIGHFVRMVHEGRITGDEGWEAICQYNAACLRPAWPLDRLKVEADAIWALHVDRNGQPLLRATMIAAERTGRRAVLLEIDPAYADVIVRRWQEVTGEAAVLEGDDRIFADVAALRARETSSAMGNTQVQRGGN